MEIIKELNRTVNIDDNDKYSLSVEMISEQRNDPVVGDLEEQFNKLIDIGKVRKLKYGKDYFKNKDSVDVFDKIDVILFKRFGIKTKHVNMKGVGYAVMPSPPKSSNVLSKDLLNTYKWSRGERAHPEDKEWVNNINKLTDTVDTSSVDINLSKATISGLPSDYVIKFLVDMSMLVNSKLTGREMVSILLHEVGHTYTHISNSYRILRTNSKLIETLRENVIEKNKDIKETIRLTYAKDLGGNPNKLPKNTTAMVVELATQHIDKCYNVNRTKHSSTDSEMLADQFSSRFGLSKEVVSSVDKLMNTYGVTAGKLRMYNDISSLAGIVLVCTYYSMAFGSVLTGTGLGLVVYVIVRKLLTTVTPSVQTYDDQKQRYVRVRNEAVKQLRSLDIDKKEVSEILNNIQAIDEVIDSSDEQFAQFSIFDKIIFKMSKTAKRDLFFKELEQLIENLMENDLHIHSKKIKLT